MIRVFQKLNCTVLSIDYTVWCVGGGVLIETGSNIIITLYKHGEQKSISQMWNVEVDGL